MTDVTLGASGQWIETRTGAVGAARLAKSFSWYGPPGIVATQISQDAL